MKYFRYAHLIYAGLFLLSTLTVLRLGTGIGFYVAFNAILAVWLVSAVGLVFQKRWGWFGSISTVPVVWLLLLVNVAVALRNDPGQSDYAKDLMILTGVFWLPVTLSLYALWRMKGDYRAV
jgi:hypothetical protein